MRLIRIIVALVLVASIPAAAATKMLKNSKPASVSSTSIECGGTDASNYGVFAAENTYSVPYLMKGQVGKITAASAAGSSASAVMQIAPTSSGPWETVATFTDPPAAGVSYSIPLNVDYVRVGIPTGAYTSGSIYFCISSFKPVQINPGY